MSARIPAGSVEYLTVPVTAPDPVDPDWSPSVAVIAQGSPEPDAGDYTAATWDGSAIRFLVGAAPLDLAAGTYDVWVRVEASPETVTRRAGLLVIV